jgi:chromosome partitioning protein
MVVPCTPSGLDLEATTRTLEIIDAVRARPDGFPVLILVPNRIDRRTLEGQQLVDELTGFREYVSPPIGDRSVFVRAFATGVPISAWAGKLAHGEIQTLADLVERFLNSTPAEAR